ncbi:SDR family NAD(P)-dependent oxidoreductase [Rhizomicrobium electricum]|uniref:SDR family oxidoreductase n=1 Tax=Rhizomicrobium electricum TaxID=480070 RepID=A0ABP3PNV4_9PROT|nr:SDR family oxidoreductase [Rhizomicrobium electricum]NIJ47113.1 NAD(P)-dependent dehydrogenase (short-subunit alcohol dehydrogenase family) [Rhizomicrobium electricum]
MSKIALITGASRGLGRATALALAARGASIIGTYASNKAAAYETAAAVAAKGGKAVMLALDTGAIAGHPAFAEAVRKSLEQFGRERFDFLVNNAGMGVHSAFAETTEADFDRLMNVHFKGVFFLTQKLLPLIADGGRILNVSSGLARFSLPGYSAYGAMKGAVEVLTRYLAKELGPRGIRVNTIAPGAIETDFGGGAVRDNKQLNDFVASITALGRAGQPDEIGGAIAALLEDGSGWINGQRVEVSGGMYV